VGLGSQMDVQAVFSACGPISHRCNAAPTRTLLAHALTLRGAWQLASRLQESLEGRGGQLAQGVCGPVTHINTSARQGLQLIAASRNRAQAQASSLALLRSTSGFQATREARTQRQCVVLVLA